MRPYAFPSDSGDEAESYREAAQRGDAEGAKLKEMSDTIQRMQREYNNLLAADKAKQDKLDALQKQYDDLATADKLNRDKLEAYRVVDQAAAELAREGWTEKETKLRERVAASMAPEVARRRADLQRRLSQMDAEREDLPEVSGISEPVKQAQEANAERARERLRERFGSEMAVPPGALKLSHQQPIEGSAEAGTQADKREINRQTAEQGVAQDHSEAVESFREAAEQGNADAQFKLAVMYDKGQGVAQDCTEAANWFRKAAEQGNADAQFNLGLMYKAGQGVRQSHHQAIKWLRRAAETRQSKR